MTKNGINTEMEQDTATENLYYIYIQKTENTEKLMLYVIARKC